MTKRVFGKKSKSKAESEEKDKSVDEVISRFRSEMESEESPEELSVKEEKPKRKSVSKAKPKPKPKAKAKKVAEETEENGRPPDIERRRLRYILFRFKAGTIAGMDRDLRELAPALQEYFESELRRKGLTWAGFTFTWDVAPVDVFDVIGPSIGDWVDRGGMFEGRPGQMTEAEWAKHVFAEGISARRKPPAFTHQE
jgi:hypothetical protein